ncbi:hypothetical protein B9Z55_007076 [Caenorhabditis nigoni]|uniref:BTB domain-containing protein n=1 Tax=Caenorhabditis nigoni TaxID=1611254 RepID=A0A2G5V860_9PELO|nr:hypothetical protein B9Z55_007076 [Caenorhabditis nigoni]
MLNFVRKYAKNIKKIEKKEKKQPKKQRDRRRNSAYHLFHFKRCTESILRRLFEFSRHSAVERAHSKPHSLKSRAGLGKEKIRNFDESQQDVSDLVVSVRNKKFYVVRMYLAAQSSFFKALLLGSFAESKKNEITLTGIDPSDFHYFLEVLYGELAIDESTVEGVTLLADMYDAPTAIRRCENFLLTESKKSLKKKLQMVTRYHLENLKKKCLEEIKTVTGHLITDLRSVLPADLNDLDPKVMADLFKKSISLH